MSEQDDDAPELGEQPGPGRDPAGPAGCGEAARRDGPEQAKHYRQFENVQIVATGALVTCHENLEDLIAARGMACIHGEPGVGKSFAVDTSLRELAADNTVRVECRSRMSTRDIRHALFHALRLPGCPPAHAAEFDRLLKAALTERFRVLVCDEAQWMATEGFEYYTHLWDERSTQIAVVFVGGAECYRVLKKELLLGSRIHLWQRFHTMQVEEVTRVIPVFHPVWQEVDKALIEYADHRAGHGNFRRWERITAYVVQAQARHDAALDADLLEWIFARLGLV